MIFTWVGWLVCLKVPSVAGGGSNSASQDSHKLLPFAPCQIQKEVSKDKLIVRHFAIARKVIDVNDIVLISSSSFPNNVKVKESQTQSLSKLL
jgi:hypothetical protein